MWHRVPVLGSNSRINVAPVQYFYWFSCFIIHLIKSFGFYDFTHLHAHMY